MWKGKQTEELNNLYDKYYEKFHCEPDWYEEIRYQEMSYDEYVAFIRKAVEIGEELPDVIE
jgi:hypothetical protein